MLTSLALRNFRSYSKFSCTFTPGTTLVLGANTTGKTNMLEAIMLLATGRSFRAKRETEMLRWETEVGNVTGKWKTDEDETSIEIRLTAGAVQGKKTQIKKYLVNDVPRRQVDTAGILRAVLFWPQDLELIVDSPSIRRKYLDSVLIQIDREYRRSLFSYERGIRQRNRLLERIREGIASSSQLLFWNQLLINAGTYITDARQRFISSVNDFELGTTKHRIEYDRSVISEARLAQYASEEIAAGTTLAGPHRDDFIVFETLKGAPRDLSRYGSRGEQRLAVLWIKLAELEYVRARTAEHPMLLLDDIFSELDETHRDIVLRAVSEQQTIITSADPGTERLLTTPAHEIIRL